MKNNEIVEWITSGFLLAILLIAFVVFIIQLVLPTKRQAYRVYRENNLTIVEKAEE